MAHLVLGMFRVRPRRARTRAARLAAVPSFLAAGTPWFFPATAAVLAGVAADAAWYFASGRLLAVRRQGRRAAPAAPDDDASRPRGAARDGRDPDLPPRAPARLRLRRPASTSRSSCRSRASSSRAVIRSARRRTSRATSRSRSEGRASCRPRCTRACGRVARSRHASQQASSSTRPTAGGRSSSSAAASASRRFCAMLATRLGVGSGARGHAAPLGAHRRADPVPGGARGARAAGPGMRVVVTATRGGAVPPVRSGRLDLDFVKRESPRTRLPASICMCGPGEMIEGFKTGLPEPWRPARSGARRGLRGGQARPRGARGAARPFTLELTVSGKSVTVPAGATLLDAAEAAGVDIAFSCRAGVCQTCRTKVVAGDVDCPADCLDDPDRREGWSLPVRRLAEVELRNRSLTRCETHSQR